jgi:Domain of unknown function (DUF6471)
MILVASNHRATLYPTAAPLAVCNRTETEDSVTVKINRGAAPAWFLFAVMKAIGATMLRMD